MFLILKFILSPRLICNLTFVILVFSSCSHKGEEADLIVHNATIYTMDEEGTLGEAMAIKDGKIVEIGPNQAILNKYTADNYLDAKTNYVYPGFIDGHCHILNYGMSLLNVDLVGCKSWEEVVQRTRDYYEKYKPNYIVGRGWDQTLWNENSFPKNDLLNKYFPDIPVMLTRIDGHAAIVNYYLIDRAGIGENSIVKGGQILIENGNPTGVLMDNAMDIVRPLLPQIDDKRLEEALLKADENCYSMGLTSLQDAGMDQRTLKKIIELQKKGKFKTRVYAMMMANEENISHWEKIGPQKKERTNIRAFKIVADGALGSRGACLKESYSDSANHYGQLLEDTATYVDAVKRLFNAGFQVNTHCIGDSANKFMLSLYARTVIENPDHRWRIEHAQVVDPQDFVYFNNYGIIPSVQPTHAVSDGDWAEKRIGKERMKGAYAYRTLMDYVAMMVLGTDFPVEEINPLRTFYAAVYRKEMNGLPVEGYHIEQGLSRIDALKGMTIWAALGAFEENEKGSLEKGKLADFVILSGDILNLPEEALRKVYVRNTVINGEPVYSYE